MTNREKSKTDVTFRVACERAGVFPSRNQYIKFKHGRGIAFKEAKARLDYVEANSVAVSVK